MIYELLKRDKQIGNASNEYVWNENIQSDKHARTNEKGISVDSQAFLGENSFVRP